KRNRAAPYQTGFILKDELAASGRLHFQQTDRQCILEIDLRRLRSGTLAKARASVIGNAFQVDAVIQARQHFGLAGARHPANQNEILTLDGLLDRIEQKLAHRLVPARHARVVNACLGLQPLLNQLRAQATAETVDVALGIVRCEAGPRLNALGLELAADKLVTKLQSGLLPMLLVAGAYLLPLDVVHQGQVHNAWKSTLGE